MDYFHIFISLMVSYIIIMLVIISYQLDKICDLLCK